jgi:hypothetical protein
VQPVEQVIIQASMAALRLDQIHHSAKCALGNRHKQAFSDDPQAYDVASQSKSYFSPDRFANSPYRICIPGKFTQPACAQNRKSFPASSYDSAWDTGFHCEFHTDYFVSF